MKAMVERRDFLGGAATLAGTSLLGLGLPAAATAAEATLDRMPAIPADKLTDVQKRPWKKSLRARGELSWGHSCHYFAAPIS